MINEWRRLVSGITIRSLKWTYSRAFSIMDKIEDVNIDTGTFKYVLCQIFESKSDDNSKHVVRGDGKCEYHQDVWNKLKRLLREHNLRGKCVGGGRMEHDPDKKVIKVYGYSYQYGRANHELTVEILQKKYPDYNVTWTDEGY
ncbi:sex-regulated protein janus-A-like [Pseudomyrmex gracilis]|uniref:sex-regulated protein janus-A-like n=1 Tax=Pseudomyrmex gracilis TaxID=219809 RepID=UPI000994EC45|nr:sex-regulated protein janus-A-like [Pseudomyrmex gracilis]